MSVVLASAPDRQANLHLRSALRAVGGLRVTTVVAGNGPHDRETQSNAAVVSGPSRIGSAEALERVRQELRRKARASISDGDGEIVSIGDDLRRAIDNLLANAVRYAPPGSTIELSAVADAHDLTVTVGDRGPGFPPELLPHAFERFRRADTARTRNDGGIGLGLAIVRAVARDHGGDAQASNRSEGGAQVQIRLPIRG